MVTGGHSGAAAEGGGHREGCGSSRRLQWCSSGDGKPKGDVAAEGGYDGAAAVAGEREGGLWWQPEAVGNATEAPAGAVQATPSARAAGALRLVCDIGWTWSCLLSFPLGLWSATQC